MRVPAKQAGGGTTPRPHVSSCRANNDRRSLPKAFLEILSELGQVFPKDRIHL
jgi:hypothetical protein